MNSWERMWQKRSARALLLPMGIASSQSASQLFMRETQFGDQRLGGARILSIREDVIHRPEICERRGDWCLLYTNFLV
ncbi:hypothetical protein F4823DRAFT_584578 [Ustulina deusta]|nr:hypothetical protein F4823DRAFT_584578 [Ustulina deusta]